MATGRITQKNVEALAQQAKRGGARLYLWDAELKGFGAMATPTGAISYVIQYRLGGRGAPTRRGVIGRHPALKPESARTMARTKLGRVAAGIDVVQEKLDLRRKLSAETFSDALELYGATKRDLRTWPDMKRSIEFNVGSALGTRPIVSITRGDIGSLIDRTAARSPAIARSVFACLRPFFK
ncbi:MAG: Arm DNA-binding domain-containing protein, partial [Parvibaculum sedimenti]|uniref:Arm DNA-binding domain-containing protein n=1 Tax=Parvibaculum sedimenti TaxID=2608632 RepID=UPI003BB6C1EE